MSGPAPSERAPACHRDAAGADGLNGYVRNLLLALIEKGAVDAVVVPVRIPSGESFVHMLTRDRELIGSSTPRPPVMPVQGARALTSLTRRGSVPGRLLCVMRPCEIRATVELAKLRQVNLENLSFLSIDCPGVFVTREYMRDPEAMDARYQELAREGTGEGLRPACRSCVRFSSRELPTDLHVGTAGVGPGDVVLVPESEEGGRLLAAVGVERRDSVADWQAGVTRWLGQRQQSRDAAFAAMGAATGEGEHLGSKFNDCVNCHNCMRVCPVCYCRRCEFDSEDAVRPGAGELFARSRHRGGIRMPGGMLEFHLGRMYHMALLCVGCGACEDACPMDVTVGQVFNYVGARVQESFGYVPGRDRDEPVPTMTFQEDELHEYEDAGGAE